MNIKRGTTPVFVFNIKDLNVDDVQEVIFTFISESDETLDPITIEEPETNEFVIGLTQQQSLKLKGTTEIEAQINYKDKHQDKTKLAFYYVDDTLGTKIVQGNKPNTNNPEAIELILERIQGDVALVITPEASDELIDAVTAIFNDTKDVADSVRRDADSGMFNGEDGQDGYSPEVTVKTQTPSTYILHIKTKTDEYDTPNLQGQGEGGTTNYNELSNKPKFNNIEWVGNKTDTDMGIATKGELQTKADKSDTYTKEETNTFLNAKADKDTTYTKTETDNLLDDKQNTITGGNGIDVSSDVVSVDNGNHLYFSNGKLNVGTISLGISDLRSELANTSYATPYKPLATREYVDNLISTSLKRLVVEQLPQNPNTYTIYMVLRQAPTTNNIYDEYMYINNAWELIGSTEVDLSNYYTKTESDNKYQLIIDSSHKVSADNIDDSESENQFTNATEKTGWNETKNDVEQIERDYFTDGDNYNMLNPANSVKGTISTTGNVTESSTSPYLVSEFIEVKVGKTYALTYKNPTFLTRFSMTPNRMCFFDTSKTFKEQSTSSSTTGTYFNSEVVTVSGNTKYYKFTPLADGYVRFQYGASYDEPQMAIGSTVEYMDYYTPPLVLANEVVAENNLTSELQQKINGENGLYEFNYVKLHEKVLFAGDSLTEGCQGTDDIRKDKSYPTIASKLMNCEGVNKGVSGITALAWWQSYGSQIDYSDYDGLFIYLGTNGGLTDTVEEDTASGDYHTYAETNTGGYCAVIAKALDDNPDIKIYVVKYGTTETSNITQKIADKYGVPTILVTDTRYFTLTDSLYHTDMTHYNSVGYWALANVLMIQVEEYIEEHLADYTDLPSAKMTSYQPLIDSTHKLSADNVDDTNTTNKFVSANEKQTWNAKADNTTISTDTTSTTVSLTLADNHEYRYTQDLTSLTLTMPSGDFIASVVFASGSTPTSMTYDSSIKWSGDDVTNGQFVPSADKDYDIMMYYNGLNVNGIVRGV